MNQRASRAAYSSLRRIESNRAWFESNGVRTVSTGKPLEATKTSSDPPGQNGLVLRLTVLTLVEALNDRSLLAPLSLLDGNELA
jgi:hypothetical protein